MDVIFISRRGSMYKYFRYLSANLNLNTRVFDFSLWSYFGSKKMDLTEDEVQQGIKFHLHRKQIKHDFPAWCWLIIERYYGFKYRLIHRRFYRLFRFHKPACIAIFNGYRLPEQAIKNLAGKLSIPVIHFENGLLPNTTTFDLNGVNAHNSVPRNIEFYINYRMPRANPKLSSTKLVQRKFHRLKKSYSQQSDFHHPLPKKFIFVPFQVLFDSQVLLNSPNIANMHELYGWIEFTASRCSDSTIQFVLKEHPSDPHRYKDLHFRNPRIIFSNKGTQELVEQSQAVITINSSVGLESLLLGKRVFVLGEACYAIEGMTKPIQSKQKLLKRVNQLDSWQLDLPLVEKFLSYLKVDYCVRGSWRTPDQRHLEEVHRRFSDIVSQSPAITANDAIIIGA